MRWLVDNALSPELADHLVAAGHDAVHVRTLNLHHAADSVVLQAAASENRILISADTDLGGLLTVARATYPSVVLFRHPSPRRANEQSALLLANLSVIEADLESGAIVVIRKDRIRVRRLG